MEGLGLESIQEGWTTFFSTLATLLRNIERLDCPNQSKIIHYISGLEFSLSSLVNILLFINRQEAGGQTQDKDVEELLDNIESLITDISANILPSLQTKLEAWNSQSSQSTPGDYGECIDEEQLCHLRTLGFKWEEIAKMFGISRMTLYRRRMELGLTEEAHFSDISDSDLRILVLALKDRFPDCGERIIIGAVRSQGFRVP